MGKFAMSTDQTASNQRLNLGENDEKSVVSYS